MAYKTIKLRDGENELTFEIRQFTASKGEDWLMKAVYLLGAQIDFKAIGEGESASIASLIHALCRSPYDEAKGLLNDLLMQCYRVDGKVRTQVTLEDADMYITSPVTLIKLRIEAAKENLGFFTALKELLFLEMGNI